MNWWLCFWRKTTKNIKLKKNWMAGIFCRSDKLPCQMTFISVKFYSETSISFRKHWTKHLSFSMAGKQHEDQLTWYFQEGHQLQLWEIRPHFSTLNTKSLCLFLSADIHGALFRFWLYCNFLGPPEAVWLTGRCFRSVSVNTNCLPAMVHKGCLVVFASAELSNQ